MYTSIIVYAPRIVTDHAVSLRTTHQARLRIALWDEGPHRTFESGSARLYGRGLPQSPTWTPPCTRSNSNVDLMLARRLRRRPRIKPALCEAHDRGSQVSHA